MKIVNWCVLLLAAVSLLHTKLSGQELKVMTYNIKNDYQKEGPDIWDNRKQDLVHLVSDTQPDILGVQEALLNQLEYIDRSFDNYYYVGQGRDDGKKSGEYCALFYNSTKFKVVRQKSIWLSDTPTKVSLGWDAAYPRICTYVLLQNRQTREKFWVLNTHFDHLGKKAREESARLIVSLVNKLNVDGRPVILMGDFNAEAHETAIKILSERLDDASGITEVLLDGPKGTYNGFSLESSKRRIDYFFVDHVMVKTYVHIDKRRADGRPISDHFPVMITVDFNASK